MTAATRPGRPAAETVEHLIEAALFKRGAADHAQAAVAHVNREDFVAFVVDPGIRQGLARECRRPDSANTHV